MTDGDHQPSPLNWESVGDFPQYYNKAGIPIELVEESKQKVPFAVTKMG